MTGTWPTARAAIKAQLHGLTISSPNSETLTALEYPPGGRQDAGLFPYAYVVPTGETVTRESGGERVTVKDIRVRVMLAAAGGTEGGPGMEDLAKRYDAWKESLKDALDDSVALGGNADIYATEQVFDGLGPFDDIDRGWGFEMTLGTMQLSESKTFSA